MTDLIDRIKTNLLFLTRGSSKSVASVLMSFHTMTDELDEIASRELHHSEEKAKLALALRLESNEHLAERTRAHNTAIRIRKLTTG